MVAGMRIQGWERNASDILGKPDIVFRAEKVLIYADGCFWHGCPVCQRKLPETNREYWQQKISKNVERDHKNDAALKEMGWTVIRAWEHEFRTPDGRAEIRRRIKSAIQEARVDRSEHGHNTATG